MNKYLCLIKKANVYLFYHVILWFLWRRITTYHLRMYPSKYYVAKLQLPQRKRRKTNTRLCWKKKKRFAVLFILHFEIIGVSEAVRSKGEYWGHAPQGAGLGGALTHFIQPFQNAF